MNLNNKFYLTNSKYRKIRIIAGKWKGYKIPVSSRFLIRPTTNQIRETLFNWLRCIVMNAVCLDCFTGSGALGLEALSRGAAKVTFIDRNQFFIKTLSQIIQYFKVYNNDLICDDCCNWLKKSNITYDIVFIDPPFSNYLIIPQVIWLLEDFNHFKKESWIYIEMPKNKNIFNIDEKLPKSWFLYRKKSTQTFLSCLYFRDSTIRNV